MHFPTFDNAEVLSSSASSIDGSEWGVGLGPFLLR
jgi:hypothetical protein